MMIMLTLFTAVLEFASTSVEFIKCFVKSKLAAADVA